jgi:hypothetical protein
VSHGFTPQWGFDVFSFILPLVAFYIAVSIFSDGAASEARWKILAVAIVATILLFGISNSSPTLIGLAVACVVAAAVSLAGLIFWIRLTRIQALKVTGAYIGFVIVYSVVVAFIFKAAGEHAA